MEKEHPFMVGKNKAKEYLYSSDSDGVYGIEKVESNIRNLVIKINFSPLAYTWGESCQGHAHNFESLGPCLEPGYLTIGIKFPITREMENFIKALYDYEKQNKLVAIKKGDEQIYSKGEVIYTHPIYRISVGKKVSDPNFRKIQSLEKEFPTLWRGIERIVDNLL